MQIFQNAVCTETAKIHTELLKQLIGNTLIMTKKIILLLILVLSPAVIAQEYLSGTVFEKNDSGKLLSLVGVNVFWLGTPIGISTDLNGGFKIPFTKTSNKLVLTLVGYTPDTLLINTEQSIKVILKQKDIQLTDIEVVGQKKSTFQDYVSIENKSVITIGELKKAACCTLSESFETNPSIDVSFTDAITGARHIEMLGLSGIYTQSTLEALPYIRGLMSNVGLTFIPGPWVKSINVAKGIGSVVNGFESITGQIDVELQKPFEIDEKPFFINFYGDNDKRFEGNLNYRFQINDKISFVTLFHASTRQNKFDLNKDYFTDMPVFSIFNLMQRWHFEFENGWESQLGFQYVNDSKEGGSFSGNAYKYTTESEQMYVYGKHGYVFPDEEVKSFGIQWSLNSYKNSSLFGIRNYSGNQKTGYLNFIYQSDFISHLHKFRTGFSFLFDQYKERFLTRDFNRIDRIPGAFFEYTFNDEESFSAVAGVRGDYHNHFGFILTPRLHIRYSPSEDWVIRGAFGRGFRESNIFTEHSALFASSRDLLINSTTNFGYGLQLEKAWNYGINFTHYFFYDYREGTISVDLYRTAFENFTQADLDSNPQAIIFSSSANSSYSNSAQIELNMSPLERFETRLAYRFLDVKNKLNNVWLERALSSKHRALINLAYSTEKDADDDVVMSYDFTLTWFGHKRIPSTSGNPVGLQSIEQSPSFVIMNLQITRTFFENFEIYLGIENLLDYRQENLIIDPMNPSGKYFDASLIWGPVNGRLVYSGLRYKM